MKVATYNVNGIKSRLPNLLAWLTDSCAAKGIVSAQRCI